MRVAITWGLVGAVIGGLLLGIHITSRRDLVIDGEPFVSTFREPDGGIETILVLGDGQAFAQLAMDPTLSHPEAFSDGRAELVYRAQRPVFGYAAWTLAFGDPTRVPEAMVVLTVLGAGLLTGALALLFDRRGVAPALALPVLVIPGVWASFPFLMSETLAAGLALAGLAAWERAEATEDTRREAIAGVLFAIAVLTRETMIFIPAGLALAQLLRTRRLPSRWLALGPLLYASWWVIVRLITGSPFLDQGQTGSRTSIPGVGLIDAVSSWPIVGRDSLFMVVTLGLAIAAVVRRRGDPLVYAGLIGLAAASLMSEEVWGSWVNWTRAITPVHLAFGLALIGPPLAERVSRPEPGVT